jgi:hypothetical protein
MAILTAYFDESGKFNDQAIISFCGLGAGADGWEKFHYAWMRLLRRYGLRRFKLSQLLRYRMALSSALPIAQSAAERTNVVKEFLGAIMDNLEIAIGSTLDVAAFKGLTGEQQKYLGDPHHLVFHTVLGQLLKHVESQEGDRFALICDDEERYSVECYKLYTRLKRTDPLAKDRLVSISFADDQHFPQLQAADLLAGLSRLEAAKRFLGEQYASEEAFALMSTPSNRMGRTLISFWGRQEMIDRCSEMKA